MIIKRRCLTFILLFLFSLLVVVHLVGTAGCRGTLQVVVNLPQNRTYTCNDVSVSITASDPELQTGPESVGYSLDGGPQVVIATVHVGMHSLSESTVLSLSDGIHSIVGIGITWFNGTADGIFYSSPIYFIVDTESTSSTESKPTESIPTEMVIVLVAVIVAIAVIVGFWIIRNRK